MATSTQRESHSDLLDRYLRAFESAPARTRVFVEVGAGLTTATIARHAQRLGARFLCCDTDERLLRAIGESINRDGVVEFQAGDSEAVLTRIATWVQRIDFAFLDAAPSAMKTFAEFRILERRFAPGSVLVLDNAAIPGAEPPSLPCRKGKILVPYLLASAHWEVVGHPQSGDAMIAAIRHDAATWSDPAYEWDDYPGDDWRRRIP